MPVFILGDEPIFPPAQLATEEGIIAAGGDLAPKRLLNAYSSGIFPWFSEGDPIYWWSPDPRMVLLPERVHISGSMKKLFKKKTLHVTFDRAFEDVIQKCSEPRVNQPETWITKEMKEAYIELHRLGYAHSVETWSCDSPAEDSGKVKDMKKLQLCGGLYGISLGRCFFGESMFSLIPNASKYAFISMALSLFKNNFLMIDCQVPTKHLESLGAIQIPRIEFLALLQKGLHFDTLVGKWNFPVGGVNDFINQ